MSLNLNTDITTTRGLQDNWRAVERHLDFDHYVRGFTPGQFVNTDAGVTHATATAASPRWPILEFVDAATSRTHVSWRKPSEWRGGMLSVRFWYTSDGGSTNNFRIQLLIEAIRDAEVLPGTLLLDNTSSYAGPAVASTLIRSSLVYTTTALGSDDELFSLRVARVGGDAADTNVNLLQVVFVEVTHIPAQQVSQ